MRILKQVLKAVLPLLLAVAVLYGFSTAVDDLSAGQADEQLRQVEEAVRRACVACYASEGVYPPDLQYLRDRYGLQLDESQYVVHYMAIAQNLMPDITVLPVA